MQAQRFQSGKLWYNITDAEAKTVEVTYSSQDNTNYANLTESASIPSEVIYEGDSYSVTSIGSQAFANCQSLTNLTIPKSIDKIHILAFSGAEALQSILLGAMEPPVWDGRIIGNIPYTFAVNVTPNAWDNYINDNNWKKLNLQVAKFQSGELYYNVTETEPKAVEVTFEKSFATMQNYKNISPNVVIPETVVYQQEEYTVTGISVDAFRNCEPLTSITIPKSVALIGMQAFDACYKLTNIQVAEGNTHYSSQDGALLNADKTTLILFPPANEATKFVVPETVTEILTSAFSYGKLKEIQIPDGVKSIGFGAFYRCEELEKVNLPRELKRIEYDTFWGCEKLTEINIPEGVTSIERNAFSGCSSLDKATLPESLDSIGNSVFYQCSSLTEINISEGVAYIGDATFSGCRSLAKVTLPESLDSISYQAFKNCGSLTEINIPKGVRHIGQEAFSNCFSLTEISLPEGITFLDYGTFYACSSLTKATLPESLNSIASSVFEGCSSLAEINIPESVSHIGDHAFSSCRLLSKLTLPESLDIIADGTFSWCTSLQEINIPESVDRIESNAFAGCFSLTGINIPEGVTYIGNDAFNYCDTLQEMTIPASVNTIGDGAFMGCTALTAFHVAEGNLHYRDIDGVLFNADKTTLLQYPASRKITEFTIPKETTSIDAYAFTNCKTIKALHVADGNPHYSDIDGVLFNADKTTLLLYPSGKEDISYTIPDGTISIAERAFYQNEKLTELFFSESVEKIEPYTFAQAKELKRAVINDKIQEISAYAFENCTKLEEIVLGKNVQTIGAYAFNYCDTLQKMTVLADNPPVAKEGAFNGVSTETVVYVPASALEAYRQTAPWSSFNLQPIDTGTAIETITTADGLRIEAGRILNPQAICIEIVDLQGRTVYTGSDASITLPEGIYVVRSKDVSRKVMITK